MVNRIHRAIVYDNMDAYFCHRPINTVTTFSVDTFKNHGFDMFIMRACCPNISDFYYFYLHLK